jgi:type IX secretion system PorP/SprF family membrane protein
MKKILILFTLIFGINQLYGQDAHFSQFYNAPSFINPAAVGDFKYDHRVSMHYRDQWRVATNPFNTMAFAYDYRFNLMDDKKDIIGLGINVLKDKAGQSGYSVTQAILGFGYHKKMGRYQLFSFGLQGGMRQHSINQSDGTWGSQYNGAKYDPSLPSGETFNNQSVFVTDVNAGAQYTLTPSKYFKTKLGVSMHHLTRPIVSLIGPSDKKEEYRYNGNFSMEISSPNHNMAFLPSVLYMKQGNAQEILAGGLVRFGTARGKSFGPTANEKGISLGGFYRYKDAVVFATQFDFGAYAIGISYDSNISGLSSGTRGVGGFEISLRYVNSPIY